MSSNETIKRIRSESGMTQIDFSKTIGCKQNTLSDYENGKANPSIKIAKRILEVAKSKKIKIKLEDLFPDEDNN